MRLRSLVAGFWFLGLVSVVAPANAEIIKVTVSGIFNPPADSDGDYDRFIFNYFVNDKDIYTYQEFPSYYDPTREVVPVYRSSARILQNFDSPSNSYTKITNIPFHAVDDYFFGYYDDPAFFYMNIYDDGYPYLDGKLSSVAFENLFPGGGSPSYGDFRIHLLDGSVQEAVEFSVGAVTLSPGPIPEPSSWAMMLLGFATTGSLLRRRRVIMSYT